MNTACKSYNLMPKEDIFSNIIGYDSVKEEMREIADMIANSDFYSRLGAKTPTGILLYGVPGVGKTLLASSFIEACGLPSYTCRRDNSTKAFIADIVQTFTRAKKHSPSIVLLDDLDKFANGNEEKPDSEEYVIVQSRIDACKNSGVLVLATANDLSCLPDSLLRSGRFDYKIKLSKPDYRDAAAIFRHYLDQKGLKSLNSELIARLLSDASCADLECIANEAALIATYSGSSVIETEHFIKACLKVKFRIATSYCAEDSCTNAVLREQPASDAYQKALRIAYHEAGHIVIGEILSPGSVTLATLSGPAHEIGGFVSHFGGTGNLIESAMNNAVIYLGGRAAIELKFGEVCAGSEDDLDKCYEIIQQLVCQECIRGLRNYRNLNSWKDGLDSATEEVIAQEISHCYNKAKQILIQNSAFLERTAKMLLEKEILLRDDIAGIKSANA